MSCFEGDAVDRMVDTGASYRVFFFAGKENDRKDYRERKRFAFLFCVKSLERCFDQGRFKGGIQPIRRFNIPVILKNDYESIFFKKKTENLKL